MKEHLRDLSSISVESTNLLAVLNRAQRPVKQLQVCRREERK